MERVEDTDEAFTLNVRLYLPHGFTILLLFYAVLDSTCTKRAKDKYKGAQKGALRK